MSKKRRVFQIARELNLSNEAVLSFLGKMDKSVRNQMSAVSEDLYDQISQKYRQENVVSDKQDFRQQLKEKQLLEELRRNKARDEFEERIRFATKLAEERPHRLKKAKEEAAAEEAKKKAEKEAAREEAAAEKKEISIVDLISKAKKRIDQETKDDEERDKVQEKDLESLAAVVEPESAGPEVQQAIPEVESGGVSEDQQTAKDSTAAVKAEEPKPAKAAGKAAVEKPSTEKDGEKEKGKRRPKKKKKRKVSEEEIQASIRQTLASMDDAKPKRRRRKDKDVDEEEEDEQVKQVMKVSEYISAAELADLLHVEAGEVITKCLQLGMMVSINQRLDIDTIVAVADEFGFEVEIIQEYGAELIDKYEDGSEDDDLLLPRPPVVTIMGHVDHGKTSLLDYIRESSVASGETGGITQHIGAYEVSVSGGVITFLDTPGHEAFTAMRARGAQITDIVVLIVAADDGVKPQTVEAINHALASGVPIVVAINKIDKPGANPELVKKQLSESNILVESWGGKYQTVEMSAKTGVGIDRLLELIMLEAELLELRANPNRSAKGVVIESKLDKGKGPIGTVLIQHGTLKVGDLFVSGQFSGKVRAMFDEGRRKSSEAPPSRPVQVVGFEGVPQAGDSFVVLQSEREVREISSKRRQLKREQDFRRKRHMSLEQLSQQLKHGEVQELRVILKADVDGSNEALSDALMKLSTEEVAVDVMHKGVGGISESDVLFAAASDAVIIGFHVRPSVAARELAKKEEIDIRLYDIIYSAVEDVKAAMEGMLSPEITEELTATIEVRETFKVPKGGTIAGCYVLSGKVSRNDVRKVKIYRDDKLMNESTIASLRRFKEDVREVASGFECGIGLESYDDVKVGDIYETYQEIQTARKL